MIGSQSKGGRLNVVVDRSLMVEVLAKRKFQGGGKGSRLLEDLAQELGATQYIFDASNISALVSILGGLSSPTIQFDFVVGADFQAMLALAPPALLDALSKDRDVDVASRNYDLVRSAPAVSVKANVEYCICLMLYSSRRDAAVLLHQDRAQLMRTVLEKLGCSIEAESGSKPMALVTEETYRGNAGGLPDFQGIRLLIPAAAGQKRDSAAAQAAAQSSAFDVFVSYARVDQPIARALVEDLTGRGYSVWWDERLLGSDEYRDEILKRLTEVKAVVVIWTEQSVLSSFVRQEANEALRSRKLVATIAKDLRAEDLPLGFRELHACPVGDRPAIAAALDKLGALASHTVGRDKETLSISSPPSLRPAPVVRDQTQARLRGGASRYALVAAMTATLAALGAALWYLWPTLP